MLSFSFCVFQITEVGKGELPAWLTFDNLKAELKGIPGPLNKEPVYLEVKATGDDNSQVTDVFRIEVLDDTFSSISSLHNEAQAGPKAVKCNSNDPKTIATVVIDCDLDKMSVSNKLSLLDNMRNHLNLEPEMIQLLPQEDRPIFDTNALVSGPGDKKTLEHPGAFLSWLVGCGRVEADHVKVLETLEAWAKNGYLSDGLGHGVVAWKVINTRLTEKRRRRRAVTPTPTLTVPPPTSISESSEDTEMTKPAMSSSVYIAPTQTMNVQPTKVVTSSSSSSSQAIKPTSTMKMDKTDTPDMTTKKMVMTSSVISTTSTSTTTESTTTTKMTKAATTARPKVVTPEPECPPGKLPMKAPKLKNPIRNITVSSGVIKKVKIPEDTFSDCYDDETSTMTLVLEDSNGQSLPKDSWLKVIKRPGRPYSILMNPLNSDAGSYVFKLRATNFYEKSTTQDFSVIVSGEEMSENQPNHELSMTIDTDYDEFMLDMENRIDFSNKVAGFYGDKNSKYMTVTRLGRGSVVYSWTNNSLSGQGCPVEGINDLVSKMVDDKGNLTPDVLIALKPYTINAVSSAPLGACAGNPNFPARTARRVPLVTDKPMMNTTDKPTSGTPRASAKTTPSAAKTTPAPVASAGTGGGSDMWITTVVPAIVVVVVLIIALIIACCLYKKKRQGRMKLQEKDPFAQNKGVPVIFADEYDEKPNDSTRPLIMEDEKPPMPPPEYPRASSETSGNSNSTQPIEDKDVEEIEMEDTDITSPLYSPPPPVTASSNSKPPHVQSSRGPPPYVPP